MIILVSCARFFDTDEGAVGRWPGQFLLGDPDGDGPIYSCLIEPADAEQPEPDGGRPWSAYRCSPPGRRFPSRLPCGEARSSAG